jgi:hypothetical protein
MQSFTFNLKENIGFINVEIDDDDTIHLNIRYSGNIDTSFSEGSWGGHYRCEITNGKFIFEELPASTDYAALMSLLNEVLNNWVSEYAEKIKKAFSEKTTRPKRF